MQTEYGTRSTCARWTCDVFDIRTGHPTMPLHLHGRRWRQDGTVAALLVYAPRLGRWFEGDELPPKVRAVALAILGEQLGRVAEVRP